MSAGAASLHTSEPATLTCTPRFDTRYGTTYDSASMLSREYQGSSFTALARRVLSGTFLLFLLTSLLLTQFSATDHELTVRHAICFEHGELIDVEDAPAASVRAGDVERRAGLTTDDVNPLTGHHQHCLFASSRGARTFATTVSLNSAHSRAAAGRVTRQHEIDFASAALYRFAPKHSPPAA